MNEKDKEYYSNVARSLVLEKSEHNYAGLVGHISAIASDITTPPAKRIAKINYLLNAFCEEAVADMGHSIPSVTP